MKGFTLLEMLLAAAIGSALMLGAARMLPLLQQQSLRLQLQAHLEDELQQMLFTLEKILRRAGYCHGSCTGAAITVEGACVLVRWDENSNGKWEGAGRQDSDYYGIRLREKNIEMQRGVDRCDGSGWEKLNDPRQITIDRFSITRSQRQIDITLEARATGAKGIVMRVDHRLLAENL